MTKYRASVIDDDQGVRDMLVACLTLCDFEAHGYDEAERALHEVFADSSLHDMPDLFVVDLQLKPEKMQGIELICELTDRNASSEIVAMAGNIPSANLVEAVKQGATTVTKPFDNIFQLIEKMEYLAGIGMRRRLYQDDPQSEMDASRHQRPVFLSYSNEDKNLATGLRRQVESRGIGVWYAPNTLKVGDQWLTQVKHGIDQARVFMPLITNNYIASPYCMAELTRFHSRLKKEVDNSLVLLPVLYNSPDKRNELIRPVIEKYQYIDLSERFIDGLTTLLGRIQRAVGQT